MSDNIIINPDALSDAVFEQLELYRKSTELKIDRCAIKAVKELVRITQDTAPFNAKSHGRHFVHCIAHKRQPSRIGIAEYVWYVKSPCYRLTHLLVKGHPTNNGGRTKGDPFLQNACDKVLPQFEKDVQEAVKDDT